MVKFYNPPIIVRLTLGHCDGRDHGNEQEEYINSQNHPKYTPEEKTFFAKKHVYVLKLKYELIFYNVTNAELNVKVRPFVGPFFTLIVP
jgi:hypothetical protein